MRHSPQSPNVRRSVAAVFALAAFLTLAACSSEADSEVEDSQSVNINPRSPFDTPAKPIDFTATDVAIIANQTPSGTYIARFETITETDDPLKFDVSAYCTGNSDIFGKLNGNGRNLFINASAIYPHTMGIAMVFEDNPACANEKMTKADSVQITQAFASHFE